ncbi:MAG: 3-oxoacyl-[acyl-carrier-protein] reductase [Inconstantimicrobium porci]|uniref:3-oxoacyl-[acyl-carrier-protein] reductase n=1 Tax=Inconstantimicrobium porci TaxID=2652291 RepID=A0A7X2N062_9CLOT|nr:3-oxoacyl-[acyl-carrier-protein] reductase [Inconstantimicrobium porci]MDD6770531.1 3-oxoacyl-[acyl-carrier-protein] reductase [Inconstantimicrobium porci]MDY5913366.1 3-oxoacyl-[acyl-carrier-protein] reductase [Inconstantimicrobium porci]MSR92346.1 3-oxoacyl-[acyl-carrier-protein] reductase [Inconstantimicrobium porci]
MLNGNCAVVTGATKGIGRAIAVKLASLGADIVINYRSSLEEAERLKEEIENLGVKTLLVKADVSIAEEAENLINEAKKCFGKVDILVNNAGIVKDNLILRMKMEDFSKVVDVNLKGTFNCLKYVSPIMLRQKKGKIINISSVVGIVGNAGQVNYAASKAGVIGMTKSLAKELGSRGIQVNAVAPGYINTAMTQGLNEKVKDEMLKVIPLKKFGEPEDVAKVVGFLASEDADYVTGQVIHVDGGMVM